MTEGFWFGLGLVGAWLATALLLIAALISSVLLSGYLHRRRVRRLSRKKRSKQDRSRRSYEAVLRWEYAWPSVSETALRDRGETPLPHE